MANELRQLVREALDIAYKLHKSKSILSEDATSMGASLEAEGKKKVADDMLNKILSSTPGSVKLYWSPQGSTGEKKLSTAQLNYIVEKLVELYKQTKDNKYKTMIAYIYSPYAETGTFKRPDGKTVRTVNEKPLYTFLLNKFQHSTELEGLLEKDPEIFKDMMGEIWNWMFIEGQVTPRKGEFKGQKMDTFDRIVAEYSPKEGSNFGALISTYFNYLKNTIRREALKNNTVSINKPTSSGKDHDLGDEIRDSTDVVNAESPEESAEEVGGEEFENITAGAEENGSEDKPSLDFTDYQTAIRKIVDSARILDIGSEQALVAFEELMLNYLNYDEIAEKYTKLFPKDENGNLKRKPGDVLADLVKKNVKFSAIMKKFESEYGIPSIANMLFPMIDKRANTEIETIAKSNKGSYSTAIKEIIKVAQSEGVDTKSLIAFEGFFLDGMSYKEIVSENSGTFKDEEEVKKVLDILLEKNAPFKEIVNHVTQKYNLNANIIDAYYKKAKKKEGELTGAQWISKAGKEMTALKNEPQPEDQGDEEEVSEEFIKENLEKIMENVYNRLKKML